MSIGSQSSGPIERWCMASVGQMATQWPQSMQRSQPFLIGTGNSSPLVIRPPGQARMQPPQPMQRLSSALMIVFVSMSSFILTSPRTG